MTQDYEKYLKNLPVIPNVATKILGMVEEKLDISFKELESIISVDPGLTAKILKVANSALYARQREITSLQIAITLLGFKNIKSLVMLVTASNMFTKYKKSEFFQTFWLHSIITAFMSKHIATRINRKEHLEELFLGGLLHDIGQTALYNADTERYNGILEKAKQENRTIEELEEEEFGINHRDLGSSVLIKWNFPDIYVDIAREHQSLNITSSYKFLILIVTTASIITDLIGYGFSNFKAEETLKELLPHVGLNEEDINYYRERYLEDLKQDSLFKECQALFELE